MVDVARSRRRARRHRAAAEGRPPARRRRRPRSRRDRLQAPAAVPVYGCRGLPRRGMRISCPTRCAGRRADIGGPRSGARGRVVALFAQHADSAAALAAFRVLEPTPARSPVRPSARWIAGSAPNGISASSIVWNIWRGSAAPAPRLRRWTRRWPPRAALAPLTESRPASGQLACLLAFWSSHARPIADDDPFASRDRRARAAIVEMLESLAAVHAAHDDPAWTIDELGIAVRRSIEDQTLVPAPEESRGVHLLDDQAVRYGRLRRRGDCRRGGSGLAGAPAAQHFLPAGDAQVAGWPSEKDRRAAGDARFLDLLTSRRGARSSPPLRSTRTRSSRARCSSTRFRARACPRRVRAVRGRAIFADESAVARAAGVRAVCRRCAALGELRTQRSAADAVEFHGTVRDIPPRAWSVSAIETYLDCPFKFFAQQCAQARGRTGRRRSDGSAPTGTSSSTTCSSDSITSSSSGSSSS